jgi:hypothetical protein
MSTLAKSYLREGVLFLSGALILIGSLAISNSRIFAIAQGEHKRLSKGIVLRKIEDDPVRITSMKVGGTARRFDEEFDDSDDWLRKLSIEIENKWNKSIIHLSVALSFPETESSGNRMTFPVALGNRPGSRSPAKRENLSLSPGDKLVINMADYYEWLSQFLRSRHSMSQINKVEIQVELAVFDDKTAWGRGTFFAEDPYKPGRYIPVETKLATP